MAAGDGCRQVFSALTGRARPHRIARQRVRRRNPVYAERIETRDRHIQGALRMKPHAFVAMPFGTKPGHDAEPIDFNRVYAEYIGPALEAAGFEVFAPTRSSAPATSAPTCSRSC